MDEYSLCELKEGLELLHGERTIEKTNRITLGSWRFSGLLKRRVLEDGLCWWLAVEEQVELLCYAQGKRK